MTGCASSPPGAASPPGTLAASVSAVRARPLEHLAPQSIIVFPTQFLSFHDNAGWVRSVPEPAEYLAVLDDEVAYALGERGIGPQWTFAAEISRIARRNSTVVSDPHALAAQSLRGKVKVDDRLEEPLGSQIRSVLALKEGRFVLLPIDLDFQGTSAGSEVGLLRVVLIDARLANVKWVGEVRSDTSHTFSPALAASIASRFADLVLPPPQR